MCVCERCEREGESPRARVVVFFVFRPHVVCTLVLIPLPSQTTHPNGYWLSVGSSNGWVSMLDQRTGGVLERWQAHDTAIVKVRRALWGRVYVFVGGGSLVLIPALALPFPSSHCLPPTPSPTPPRCART